jgi:signal transduction histidine kinase
MKRVYLLIWLSVTLCTLARGQGDVLVYSLLNELKQVKDDSVKLDLYIRLANAYYPQEAEKAASRAKMALMLSQQKGDVKSTFRCYDILMRIGYNIKLDLPAAVQYLELAMALDSSQLTVNDHALLLGHQGNIFLALNDFEKAQDAFYKQLKIYERQGNKAGLATVHFDLGKLNVAFNDFNQAIDYFKMALKEYDDLRNTEGKIKTLDAIGKSYGQLHEYRKNLEFCTDALFLSESLNDPILLGTIHLNVGFALARLSQREEAYQHFEEAYDLGDRTGNNQLFSAAANELGNIYLDREDTKTAAAYFEEAMDAAKKTGNKALIKDIYTSLHQFYFIKGKPELAYKYLLRLYDLQDTLNKEEKMRRFTNDRIKYESEKKEAENKKLTAQSLQNQLIIQRQRLQNYALLAGIAAMIALSFTLYKAFKRKKDYNDILEQEVLRRTQQLNISNNNLKSFNFQLEQTNKELERFAYIASHDLKAPLRNIISFTNLIERKLANSEDTDLREYLRFVVENARQMNTLIKDVLEFSQLDSNEGYHYELTDLNESVYMAIKNLQENIAEKKAVISVEELPQMNTSPMHIVQLLQNLIGNGLKYNESETPEIHITCVRERGQYKFSVQDNGIGISKEFHEQIFEMFRRLHPPSRYKGTGIGLAICHKIIQRLGGKIWLESEPGKGSVFYFTIPAVPVPSKTAEETMVV